MGVYIAAQCQSKGETRTGGIVAEALLYQYAAYVTSFAGYTPTRKYGSSGRDVVQMLLSHPIAAD